MAEHEEGCICHLCLPGTTREPKKTEDMHEDLLPRPYFQQWAEANGVNMEHEEDWKPWWDCWCHGYNKGVQDIKEII